jgi:phosphatidylglycerol:prolipoprotein diacylglycerol transferase
VFPTLGDLFGIDLPVPTHDAFVALGLTAALAVFLVEARRRRQTDLRLVYVVTAALVGGAIFMRLGPILQHVDLRANPSVAEQWVYGNRSILGGLFGAWLGAHVGKRLTGYTARTGDLFAPAVALGMTIGRFGCLFTELPGSPNPLGFGPALDQATAARLDGVAGVALHPSFGYEIAFHAVAFVVLWRVLRHRLTAPGETLVVYLAAYGVFRFLVEFTRGDEVVWAGLDRSQLFLLLTVPLLLARVAVQWRRGAYTLAPRQSLAPASAVAQGPW